MLTRKETKMKVQITIDVENAAFEESSELPRILERAGELAFNMPMVEGCFISLQDINGNVVGRIKVVK